MNRRAQGVLSTTAVAAAIVVVLAPVMTIAQAPQAPAPQAHPVHATAFYIGRRYVILWRWQTRFGRRARLGALTNDTFTFWCNESALSAILAPEPVEELEPQDAW